MEKAKDTEGMGYIYINVIQITTCMYIFIFKEPNHGRLAKVTFSRSRITCDYLRFLLTRVKAHIIPIDHNPEGGERGYIYTYTYTYKY